MICKIFKGSLFDITIWESRNGGCLETGGGFLIFNLFYLLLRSNREVLRSILTWPLEFFLYMFIFKNFHLYDKVITCYLPCISWNIFWAFFCFLKKKSHRRWEPSTKSTNMKLTSVALYHILPFWDGDFICYHCF